MPLWPQIRPPVGKSGPGRTSISSRTLTSGFRMNSDSASATSPGLCGGKLHAMPTAMPIEPLTSRFGKRAGSTVGSVVDSS